MENEIRKSELFGRFLSKNLMILINPINLINMNYYETSY